MPNVILQRRINDLLLEGDMFWALEAATSDSAESDRLLKKLLFGTTGDKLAASEDLRKLVENYLMS